MTMSEIEKGYEGAERAIKGTPEGWREEAKAALKLCAEQYDEFCSDDVWNTGLQKPDEARALGAIFTWGARQGLIEKTQAFKRSEQEGCHGMDVRVWKSIR